MVLEPLPNTGISRILGLLEILDDRGGSENIYRIAQDIRYEFGDLLAVIKGAELLGLVETPGGEIVLTETGRRVVLGDITQRKQLVRERLNQLNLFRFLTEALRRAEGHELDREVVLEQIALLFPYEEPEVIFEVVTDWGRYGQILGYDHEDQRLYLPPEN